MWRRYYRDNNFGIQDIKIKALTDPAEEEVAAGQIKVIKGLTDDDVSDNLVSTDTVW